MKKYCGNCQFLRSVCPVSPDECVQGNYSAWELKQDHAVELCRECGGESRVIGTGRRGENKVRRRECVVCARRWTTCAVEWLN